MTIAKRFGVGLIGALLGIGGVARAEAAGAWIAESRLPDIHREGVVYRSPWLTPRPTTPLAGQALTRVSWRYGYDRPKPIATIARLCTAKRCIDASANRAASKAFAGQPIKTPFRLLLKIPRDRRLKRPLRAGRIHLIVNFE